MTVSRVLWPLTLAIALATMTLIMLNSRELAVSLGLATLASFAIAVFATILEDASLKRSTPGAKPTVYRSVHRVSAS